MNEAATEQKAHEIVRTYTYHFGCKNHKTRCWYYVIEMIGGSYRSHHDDPSTTVGRYFTQEEAEAAMQEHIERIKAQWGGAAA